TAGRPPPPRGPPAATVRRASPRAARRRGAPRPNRARSGRAVPAAGGRGEDVLDDRCAHWSFAPVSTVSHVARGLPVRRPSGPYIAGCTRAVRPRRRSPAATTT